MATDRAAVFKYITQGVYVISVTHAGEQNAFTAAWVMQVSFAPPLICFSINSNHHSYTLLRQGGVCCISVLNNTQYEEAEHFGRSDSNDKMANYSWLNTESKAPALADSIAYFDCRVSHYSDAGDHKLVVCELVDAVLLHDAPAMTYADTENMDGSSKLYSDK